MSNHPEAENPKTMLVSESSSASSVEREAVVLLSGGLDSATVLAMAVEQGFSCHALSFRYGQRHSVELEAATVIAQEWGCSSHKTVDIDLSSLQTSALTNHAIALPEGGVDQGIPVTYVPARNTLFLSLALGVAESLGAFDIFIGVNAVDYSGYPDCRPEFIEAFTRLAQVATKAGVEGNGSFSIHTPLMYMDKVEIIKQGIRLGVDYSQTISCYQASRTCKACGVCDSCRIRSDAFAKLSTES